MMAVDTAVEVLPSTGQVAVPPAAETRELVPREDPEPEPEALVDPAAGSASGGMVIDTSAFIP